MNHHRKWIRRLMRWMWCVLVLTVCQQTLCIEQPFRLVAENTTCLDIEVASRLACTGNDQFYHCLLDENYTKEFEVCRDWKWIPGGKCAYFNSYGRGNVDERNCEGNLTLKCAPGQFRSYMNTQYKACYIKKRIPTTTPINTVTIRPTSSGGSDIQNTTGGAPPGSAPPKSQFNGSALGIALGVIVPLIIVPVIVGILHFKKRRCPQDTSKAETAVEMVEGERLVNAETECMEENEQNDKQQKHERTSTENAESSPLLAGNTNQNQSQDERTVTEDAESSPLLAGNTNENQKDSVKIQIHNSNSPQKNEPYLTPPTSPTTDTELQTEGGEKTKDKESIERPPSPDKMLPDDGKEDDLHLSGKQNVEVIKEDQSEGKGNEEDTSKETERKDAVGTFVSSLESITIKEDDEEVGSSELQELLEDMCTGPASKILFNVVKMNVENPDSYIQDKSKTASLKSVLPPEYHSAINPESEYKHSIPVCYAILQSSLSAEHQPKSRWGQEVKDTDTGVGDDVERVYKVHMLSREIQNPKEISVDGYLRLFEMLIGAVERLDIPVEGGHSEEYKEIEGKWKDIQRKPWWKDTWNTLTNLIKIW